MRSKLLMVFSFFCAVNTSAQASKAQTTDEMKTVVEQQKEILSGLKRY
jgi:hypothetical protein